MDDQLSHKSTTDIVLNKGALVAKLLGVVNPVSATAGVIADCIKERRSDKFTKRLQNLITSLEERVCNLEDDSESELNLDLLDEIIAKAVSEEDEDKTPYYAALIEYYAKNKLEPYEVRLLGNALKELTVYELESFVKFIHDSHKYRNIPEPLQEIFWNRLEYLGLFKGGRVKHKSNTTVLGKKLSDIYQLAVSES